MAKELYQRVKAAETLDRLTELEEDFRSLNLASKDDWYELLSDAIQFRRDWLVERARADEQQARADKEGAEKNVEKARADEQQARADEQQARADEQQARAEGTFFEDARNLFELQDENIPDKESLEAYFATIFRKKTPSFYQNITKAAAKKTEGGKFQQINDASIGSNSAFSKGKKDMFGNPTDPVRAHLFVDSPTCGRYWSHMAEGATGVIEMEEDPPKKKERLLRMMGSKMMVGKQGKHSCLRCNIHNFVSLPNAHRRYFDDSPQLVLVPVLSLEEISEWKENQDYHVLVFVASPRENTQGMACPEVYRAILSHFPWETFDGKRDVGTLEEISDAFEMLRHFIKALAYSLLLEIPQQFADLADSGENESNDSSKSSNNNKGSRKKKKNKGPPTTPAKKGVLDKKNDLEKVCRILKENRMLPLPHRKESMEGLRPVLKLHFNGDILADPWLLMVKAAVNFGWIAYGFKLLPACLPLRDDAEEAYEEALLEYLERRRKSDCVPTTLVIPSFKGGTNDEAVTPPGASAPPAHATPRAIVTPPGNEEGSKELNWETLSDSSYD